VELFPAEIQGLPYFTIGALYAGNPEEGQRILRPLRDFSPPLIDFSGITPYVEAQKTFDADYPDGWRYYWKSTNLTRLDDAAIERIVEHALRQPSPFSTTDLWPVGGAVARADPEKSAFFRPAGGFLAQPRSELA
jgi:hypothetical protein